MLLIEMLQEAGCPPGVVNVIHGAHDAVNFICDHPKIKAVSFVGSTTAVSFNNKMSSLNFSILIVYYNFLKFSTSHV